MTEPVESDFANLYNQGWKFTGETLVGKMFIITFIKKILLLLLTFLCI